MTQITLSDEFTRQISEASMPIVLVDSRGRRLGELSSVARDADAKETISDDELAEIKRRMANDNGERYTTAQVLQYLRELAPE
jgi:hypothetical protein